VHVKVPAPVVPPGPRPSTLLGTPAALECSNRGPSSPRFHEGAVFLIYHPPPLLRAILLDPLVPLAAPFSPAEKSLAFSVLKSSLLVLFSILVQAPGFSSLSEISKAKRWLSTHFPVEASLQDRLGFPGRHDFAFFRWLSRRRALTKFVVPEYPIPQRPPYLLPQEVGGLHLARSRPPCPGTSCLAVATGAVVLSSPSPPPFFFVCFSGMRTDQGSLHVLGPCAQALFCSSFLAPRGFFPGCGDDGGACSVEPFVNSPPKFSPQFLANSSFFITLFPTPVTYGLPHLLKSWPFPLYARLDLVPCPTLPFRREDR